jgi:cardiolipin synthase
MTAMSRDSRVATIPNLISLVRLLCAPLFVVLLVDDEPIAAAVLLAVLGASDWVDGWIARHFDQGSDLGKVLDPVADRLAIAAGIIALAIRGVFPVWAAVAIIARDVLILGVGVYLLSRRHIRLEVRWIGKVATFSLMVAVPAICWGALDLPLAAAATAVGWVCFAVGIVEYYIAAGVYAQDARRALASP